MPRNENDRVNLNRILSVDEEQQRHAQAILHTSPSAISFDTADLPRSVIDVLDDCYSNRTHRHCIDRSYLTLLSMLFTVIFWICYWLTSNRCENLNNSFTCGLVILFEVLTYLSICISPFLFIFMIYSWINYSCYNPFDLIRENFVGFKLEGQQWKEQLKSYYENKKSKCFNCFRYKQRKELNERDYGYIILSPYGIVIDELTMFYGRKNIIHNGILLDNEKILKTTLKKTCLKPWKHSISIYLPNDLIDQNVMEELMNLLKIPINIDCLLSIV